MSRYYSQGEGTLKVSMELFALNRQRLVESLKKLPNLPANAAVMLQGGQDIHRDSTDVVNLFRQVNLIYVLVRKFLTYSACFVFRNHSSTGLLE